jgi:hypothetical protein
MTSTTAIAPGRAHADVAWLRLVQLCVAAGVVPLAVLAVVLMFFTTVSEGDFRYTADYWLTAPGLPIAVVGIGHALGVHQLQHGADGRLGTIGVWLSVLAQTELFVQLLASVVQGTEVRWGPSYPVCALLTFIGIALLAAGSWRTQLLPRWMLGVWPLLWVLGSYAAQGPTPFLLVAFLVAFTITLTRRVRSRTASPWW